MRGDENEMKGNKKGSEPENTIIAPDPSLVASKEDKGKITEINNGEIKKDLPQKKHITKSTLKDRGWTEAGINRYLKEPDEEVDNPYYKSAAPMRLYLISRVEKIEKSKEFLDFKEKNIKKTAGAKKAVETKKERLFKEVQEWEIELVREDYEKVVKDAINSYNAFNENKASERKKFHYIPATIDSDSAFLKRITTNYLRHKLSNYEDKLVRIFGKTGKTKAYIVINRKIAGKIAEVYPELA